jgi:hypothetical protein
MWETNTFAASFHARLNVAPQAKFQTGTHSGCGTDCFNLCHKFRSTVAGF